MKKMHGLRTYLICYSSPLPPSLPLPFLPSISPCSGWLQGVQHPSVIPGNICAVHVRWTGICPEAWYVCVYVCTYVHTNTLQHTTFITLITLIASFLPWNASLILKSIFSETHTQSVGYSLGMVKMEAFDDSHFMHQAVRGGHTDHTGSIVSSMACIFDLKKKFLCNRKCGL